MGYDAGTYYTEIYLAKENFAEIEKRFQTLMDSQHPTGHYLDGSETWRERKYGKLSYYTTASKKFVVDDIFNTFGFEYTEDKEGNITDINYPDSSYNNDSVDAFLSLLEGLIAEGGRVEWLGSSGDDDRWMHYHHNGKWTQHGGVMEIEYMNPPEGVTF